jgi:LuxR family maltose regulon positive regulatory protein
VTAVDADNDPAHLLGSIVRGLHAAGALPPGLVHELGGPRADQLAAGKDHVLAVLAAALHPAVLVLDAVEVLQAPDALGLVAAVVEHVGPGSTVAIASRAEPAFAIGRLRAEDGVVELRIGDLLMTEHESELLLHGAGLTLDPAQLTRVVGDTEGWPAGLHLAGLAVVGQEDRAGALSRFAGDDRIVADYLRDEVLAGLTADELSLLTRTAPLERLSGPLCDEVLDRQGSGVLLCDLARAGALLAPLDRCEATFRVHPLLAGLLRADLRRSSPRDEPEVHRRASAFYERLGDVDGAIDHAIAAGDADRTAALLWTVVPAQVTQGRTDDLQRRLDRLSDGEIAARPALALAAAACRVAHGDRALAERWIAAAERGIVTLPPDQARPLACAAAAMRASGGHDGVERMRADARAVHALADDDSPWRAVACLLEGVAAHLTGDREQASERLEEGARRAAGVAPAVRALCFAQLALIALEAEDVAMGGAFADRACDTVDRAGLADAPGSALAFAVAAFSLAQRGRVAEARRDAVRARRLLALLDDAAPWFDAETRVSLARAELRLSDAAAARALLAEASRSLRRVPEHTAVHAWIDDAWARADTFAVSAVAGPSTLTTAELRVLRFLPSHLSFREIAARLHVSTNTVKTQAHAVYRKLDASSRSEAVAWARAVGLVDG